jgi:hypothetical protein
MSQGHGVLAKQKSFSAIVLHLPRSLCNDGSQGSSVKIVIRIWAGLSLTWFLAGAKDFLSPKCPDWLHGLSNFLFVGCEICCAEVRNVWSYTSASPYAFMAWTVIVFTSARSLWSIHSKISVTTVLRPEIEDTPSIFSTFQ